MKTLIIYAHPRSKGHSSETLKQVISGMKARKIDHEIIDLYKIAYDPVLHDNELYTAGKRDVSKQNKEFQEKIKQAERLIFIYPVWWSTMPAILKGFIDRIFVSHFAFRYVNGIPHGLLKGKKAAVFISAGAPRWYSWLVLRDRPAKIMVRDILKFCGVTSKAFIIGKATQLTQNNILNIKKNVNKGLNYLYD